MLQGYNTMTVLPFISADNPILHQAAAKIEDLNVPEAQWLATDLKETLAATRGVGLAAPQLGIAMRAIAIRIPAARVTDDELDTPTETQILFNPNYEVIGTETRLDWEGCLSLPGIKARIRRHHRIRYNAQGIDGRIIAREVTGFHARVIQHEIDHLNGILMVMRTELSHADIVDMNHLAKITANDDLAAERLNIALASEL